MNNITDFEASIHPIGAQPKSEQKIASIHHPIPWRELGTTRLAEAINIVTEKISMLTDQPFLEIRTDWVGSMVQAGGQKVTYTKTEDGQHISRIDSIEPDDRYDMQFRLNLRNLDPGAKIFLRRERAEGKEAIPNEDPVIFEINCNLRQNEKIPIELAQQLEEIRSALELAGFPIKAEIYGIGRKPQTLEEIRQSTGDASKPDVALSSQDILNKEQAAKAQDIPLLARVRQTIANLFSKQPT